MIVIDLHSRTEKLVLGFPRPDFSERPSEPAPIWVQKKKGEFTLKFLVKRRELTENGAGKEKGQLEFKEQRQPKVKVTSHRFQEGEWNLI